MTGGPVGDRGIWQGGMQHQQNYSWPGSTRVSEWVWLSHKDKYTERYNICLENQRKCKAPVYVQRNDVVAENLKKFREEMDWDNRGTVHYHYHHYPLHPLHYYLNIYPHHYDYHYYYFQWSLKFYCYYYLDHLYICILAFFILIFQSISEKFSFKSMMSLFCAFVFLDNFFLLYN